MKPFVESAVAPSAHLISDEHDAYQVIGRSFSAHDSVRHGQEEFVRGQVHSNKAESFHAALERAEFGVYHWMSKQHLPLYPAEGAFHLIQRIPETRVAKKGKNEGKLRTFMMRLPILEQFELLLKRAPLRPLPRTKNSGIRIIPAPVPLLG